MAVAELLPAWLAAVASSHRHPPGQHFVGKRKRAGLKEAKVDSTGQQIIQPRRTVYHRPPHARTGLPPPAQGQLPPPRRRRTLLLEAAGDLFLGDYGACWSAGGAAAEEAKEAQVSAALLTAFLGAPHVQVRVRLPAGRL